MRTFFLENHAPSASKLSITLDQQPEVLYSLFLLYVQVENDQSKYIDTEVLSRDILFLIDFRRHFLFFFGFFWIFVFLFFLLVCLFFEIKNIYFDTHSTMGAGEWKNFFTFSISGNKTTVDSLISGHHRGNDFCPLIGGVHYLENLIFLTSCELVRGTLKGLSY